METNSIIQRQQPSEEERTVSVDEGSLPLRRINADDHKKWIIFVYVSTFVVFIIFTSLISAFALPHSLIVANHIKMTDQSGCKTMVKDGFVTCAPAQIKDSYDGIFIEDISNLNQFIFFYLQNQNPNKAIDFNQNVKCSLYVADQLPQNTNDPSLKVKLGDLILQDSVNLRQNQKGTSKGKQQLMLFLTKLEKNDKFYWQLQFGNNTNVNYGSYHLYAIVVDPQFTIFTIIIRVVLFLLSLVVFLKYNQKIFNLRGQRVSLEQRLIQVLSFFTLTFNDQFYAISVLVPNPFSSFLSTFFIWNYVAFLFILWIFFLKRIKTEDQNAKILTIPFSLLFIFFYVIVLVYSSAYAISQFKSRPVFSYQDINSGTVKALSIIAFIAFIIACLYIIYLYVYILRYRENRLYRHKVFMNISFFFFVSTITFFFLGGYNIFSYSAPKIFFTFSFMNLYSFALQFLYFPTQISQNDAQSYLINPRLVTNIKTGEVQIQLSESNRIEQDEKKSDQNDQGRLSARQRRRRRIKQRENKLSKTQEPIIQPQERQSAQQNPIQIQID